jgi:RNA polymerase sigma-70 factor, ECF subfamily
LNAIQTTPSTSDIGEEILRAAFNGESDAFEQVVKRYEQPVYHLCVRFLGVGAEAEDIAQETFIKAFVKRSNFDLTRPLMPWLLTIARRLCIDQLRYHKRANVASNETDTLESRDKDAEEMVSDKERVSIISSGLEALPEGQRESVVLYHVDGLGYKEIAEVLDVPMGTVMTWLHRGRAKLQKWYLERTDSDGVKVANGVKV